MPKRGENIYKRKDGRWEGRYILERNLCKIKYGYIYAKSYSEAKEKLNQAKTVKPSMIDKNVDFNKMSLLWLESIKSNIKHSSYVKYYNILTNHINPIIGKQKLISVNSNIIHQFAEYKRTCGRIDGNGGLSPKTVNDIVSVIYLISKYACEMGMPVNADMLKVRLKQPPTVVTALSRKEQKVISDYLINNFNNVNLGILLCLYTGLRIGEICAMKFSDISSTDEIISVRKTMQRVQCLDGGRRKTCISVNTPKSECSIRDIPIPHFIMNLISKYNLYSCDSYILSGRADAYIEPRTLENKFKKCLKACNIENVKFHILRHTFATRCIELGVEIKSLSEILGHSNVNITLNRYVHSSMDLKRKNIEKLSADLAI